MNFKQPSNDHAGGCSLARLVGPFKLMRSLRLFIMAVRIIDEYQRWEAGPGRLVSVTNLFIDPLCHLTHDGVHPCHVLWDNLRTAASLPLRTKPMRAAWSLLKHGVVYLDRDRCAVKGRVKCCFIAHTINGVMEWPNDQVERQPPTQTQTEERNS